jgi:aldehyde:ferredoxin oxidoreductase
MKKFDEEELVKSIFSEEKERCMLNSLCICLFARKVYDRKTVLSALNSIGIDFTDEDLTRVGEEILKLKMEIKSLWALNLKTSIFLKDSLKLQAFQDNWIKKRHTGLLICMRKKHNKSILLKM